MFLDLDINFQEFASFWPLLTKLWVLICSLTTNWLTISVGGFTCHNRWTSSLGFSFNLLGKVYELNWIHKMLMSQQCEEFVASFHWFWCQILPKRSYQKLQVWWSLMVIVIMLNSRSSRLSLNPGWYIALGKAIYSYSASLHPNGYQ